MKNNNFYNQLKQTAISIIDTNNFTAWESDKKFLDENRKEFDLFIQEGEKISIYITSRDMKLYKRNKNIILQPALSKAKEILQDKHAFSDDMVKALLSHPLFYPEFKKILFSRINTSIRKKMCKEKTFKSLLNIDSIMTEVVRNQLTYHGTENL